MIVKMIADRRAARVCARYAAMFLIGFALLLSAPAFAQEAEDLKGEWRGGVDVGRDKVVTILTVVDVELGEPSGDLAWRSPLQCRMDTEYGSPVEDRFVLKITNTNGGHCDRYRRGTVLIALEDGRADSLTFELLDRHGERPVIGELDRSAR